MNFLAILTSVSFESDLILLRLKKASRSKIAGKNVYKGKFLNYNIVLMNTGIGKVNAAHSTTAILEHFPIRWIVNSGIGGAYPHSGLNVGDIAIASKEIYGDDGVINSKGWEGVNKIGIPLLHIGKKKYFNEFPLDKRLAKKISNSMLSTTHYASRIMHIKAGNFVTLSATTGTHKRALELERRFNAICENMEGAAIAHICTIYNIPLLEIRGISNIVGNRNKRRWNLRLASENCQEVVLSAIRAFL